VWYSQLCRVQPLQSTGGVGLENRDQLAADLTLLPAVELSGSGCLEKGLQGNGCFALKATHCRIRKVSKPLVQCTVICFVLSRVLSCNIPVLVTARPVCSRSSCFCTATLQSCHAVRRIFIRLWARRQRRLSPPQASDTCAVGTRTHIFQQPHKSCG
jgi:hypothetical protein